MAAKMMVLVAVLVCLAFVVAWAADEPAQVVTKEGAVATAGGTAKPGEATKSGEAVKGEEAKWVLAVEPKGLSENVKRGLSWLAEHQLKSGAWGQGEESTNMGGGAGLKDTPSVGDTCMAALALVRSGSTPAKGDYRDAIRKAVEFVCSQVEESDQDSLKVTSTQGTRIQGKLGQNIDTFMACLLLSEVKDRMVDKDGNDRVAKALDKVLHKMKVNQKENGTWGDQGWATALAMNMGAKGYNRAAQSGAAVDEKVREKAEEYSRAQYDQSKGNFKAEGTAGVALYGSAGSLGAQSDSVNTNATKEKEAGERLAKATTDDEKKDAQKDLDRYDQARKDLESSQKAVIAKLDDKQFIAGFGSNGGEEFLSYMNIGESLVVKGGDDWKKWDADITKNLSGIQNSDGSWTGHHCITGRTFCTSSALLVLMVDRTPVPLAAKIGRR